MATLATIRARVLAKLVDAGGSIAEPSTSQVTAEINSAIDYYEPESFWFNDEIATGTLTIGSGSVTLPNDFCTFIEPSGLTIEISNSRYPLKKITPLAYDSMYSAATRQPLYYTYRHQSLLVYPIPSQAYAYRLFYTKSYADLVNDSDTNDFTNYAEFLIEYQTLARCYRDYRSDAESAAVYEIEAGKQLNRIVDQSRARLATGELTTENITRRAFSDYSYSYY